MSKKYSAPTNCPVCNNKLHIIKLGCSNCKTEITGIYEDSCKFCSLDEEDQFFLEVFIKCRGSIKDVEKEMGISYPTVRGKLDDLISKMGYTINKSSTVELTEKKSRILNDLEIGKITVKKATELLKKINKGEL